MRAFLNRLSLAGLLHERVKQRFADNISDEDSDTCLLVAADTLSHLLLFCFRDTEKLAEEGDHASAADCLACVKQLCLHLLESEQPASHRFLQLVGIAGIGHSNRGDLYVSGSPHVSS